MLKSVAILALAAATEAHFRVTYPYWRGDSFATGKSQWYWPCANVTQEVSSTNRTAWPLDGGSLVLTSSHSWVQTFVNLGLGDQVTGFNVSLVAAFNATGNGTVCYNQIGRDFLRAANISDGQTASLQVVNINDYGNALYNCADIVFRKNATLLPSNMCMNSTGIGGYYLTAPANATRSATTNSTSASASAASATRSSAADVNHLAMGAVVGSAALAAGALLL